MVTIEEINQNLNQLEQNIEKLKCDLKIEEILSQVAGLQEETLKDDFWNDAKRSQSILQEIKGYEQKIKSFNDISKHFEDLTVMVDLVVEDGEDGNEETLKDLELDYQSLIKDIEMLNLSTFLSGEYDKKNAILTFHAGAGGTESQDWVEMLYRMYAKWAEKNKYKVKVLDYLDGEEAGIKSLSILVEGLNSYGFLKSEAGVHRLVRISPFDSSGRRHTSFAAIEVIPEIEDDVQIDIRDEDLKIDTYRASGAGGQHVNKTESAVRITHLPTGVVVACQNERSQKKNKDTAMKMLKSKLVEIKEREHLEKIEDIKGDHREIGWGSQIRSYVFMPYTLVKDHRTGFEMGDVNSVMNGNIDGFINAYLVKLNQENLLKKSDE